MPLPKIQLRIASIGEYVSPESYLVLAVVQSGHPCGYQSARNHNRTYHHKEPIPGSERPEAQSQPEKKNKAEGNCRQNHHPFAKSEWAQGLLELRTALTAIIYPTNRRKDDARQSRKRYGDNGSRKRPPSPKLGRSAMGTVNVVNVAEFNFEQRPELPAATEPFDGSGFLIPFFAYLNFDSAQGSRIMPRVPDVIFMNHESGNALGLQSRAKHVRLPRLTECRNSRQHVLRPPEPFWDTTADSHRSPKRRCHGGFVIGDARSFGRATRRCRS